MLVAKCGRYIERHDKFLKIHFTEGTDNWYFQFYADELGQTDKHSDGFDMYFFLV